MIKVDIVNEVSRQATITKVKAEIAVDAVFDALRASMERGERIELRGFGVFQVKDTRPKPAARNPRTGQIIYVPARRKPQFKPGRLLKEALHQKRDGTMPLLEIDDDHDEMDMDDDE